MQEKRNVFFFFKLMKAQEESKLWIKVSLFFNLVWSSPLLCLLKEMKHLEYDAVWEGGGGEEKTGMANLFRNKSL